ncbi:MAG: Oleate hydroxylase fah12 [Stictis urceolatum]|nr:Oleate hydroxylase fah12 [Stictis urceolata]
MSTPRSSRRIALQRAQTADSLSSSVSPSIAPSPMESPKQSPSSTSLSSMDSDIPAVKQTNLYDANGNEFQLPDFTIKQIRDAIPKHCYERSGTRGLLYVARDILYLSVVFYAFNNYVTPEYIPSQGVRAGLWALYTVVQGMVATGIWVLAHECGHQSFSTSKILNDTVGWICHSALLVPYFSWKISHGKHHKATGNMERDMVFVPKDREEFSSRMGHMLHELHELTEETPIATVLHLVGQQLFGWPLYLITNVTGHDKHEKQPEGRGKGKKNGLFSGVNHFNTSSPLYEAKDAKLVLLSDLGIAITGFALYALTQKFGLANMAVWYFLPYLWVNHWLVAITFLQHTDPTLPHYTGDVWSFTRGAAATIDREFGFVGRHLFHGIIETHVLHHYVSTIPFYNADEASEAIKPVMGRHYRADVRGGPIGFLGALWQNSRSCQWVEPNEGAQGQDKNVLFFRNRNSIGVKPTVLRAS